MKAPPVQVKLEPPSSTLPPVAEDDEDEDLFGEAAESEGEMSEDTGDPYCSSPKKASRKKPKPMSLQAAMRSMRGRNRKLPRRRLDTDLPSLGSGGGGGGDDMED